MATNKGRAGGFGEDALPFDRETSASRAAAAVVTATEAKNRFGEVLDMARKDPVHIQKNGRTVAVLVSMEQFEAYEAGAAKPSPNPLIMKLHEESKKRWGKVYEALAK